LQGRNSEFARIRWLLLKFRLEKTLEFSSLQDPQDEIPCAAEQGIKYATTGSLIPANRELNPPQQGIGQNRFARRDEALIPRRRRCSGEIGNPGGPC
jgi:hypothetical protein